MAKKYYAVKKGLTPGIYLTWEDCRRNITGFPGAEYKGFETVAEAAAFLEGSSASCRNSDPAAGLGGIDADDGSVPLTEPGEAVAYVDGSYNIVTKEYACGVVLFHDEKTEYFSKKFSDSERAEMRNVAGEIEGSMCAMSYCLEHGIGALTIYYDYEGIEKWCTRAWKANKEGTVAYREFYDKISRQVQIRFVKVKGHSGDKYNDLADKLAKQAIGLEK